jgi:Holliday junction resolvasome RuvABC endonuclease subunit
MKILTIDPSMSHTALVLFELDVKTMIASVIWSTTLNTEKTKSKQVRASSDLIGRCRDLYEPTQHYIKIHQPDLIFAETPSGSKSASGMKSYGVSCFLLATLTPSPIEVTPIEVKKATVGNKTASKAEMIAWAFNKHPELEWKLDKSGKPQVTTEEHKADAVAVFYAGIKTADFSRALSVLQLNKAE